MSIATIGRAVHQIIERRIARGENTGIEFAELDDLKCNVLIFDGMPNRSRKHLEHNKVVTAEFYREHLAYLCPMLYDNVASHAAWWSYIQDENFSATDNYQIDENLEDERGELDGTYVAVVRDIALTAMDVRNHTVQRDRPAEATKTTPPSPPKDELPWPF